MQEDVLQPLLTVTEAMVTAAKLKLGTEIGHDEKLEVVGVLERKTTKIAY